MRGQLHSCKVIEWEIRFPIPMHVDDVLLASGDVNLLQEEKRSSCPQSSKE